MNNSFQKALRSASGLFLSLLITTIAPAQSLDSATASKGQVRTIHSKVLGEKRTITVHLPSERSPYDRYPVLYLLDGEVFSTMISGQISYLSEAYKILPKLVIVSIENKDRMRDLTPTHTLMEADGKPDTAANSPLRKSGGGVKFIQFIKEELMPFIEANYNTAPYRILFGHSLGGLMAVYCLLEHPDYFDAYIAVSPSLQWDGGAVLKEAARKPDVDRIKNKILFFSDAYADSAFHKNQVALDSILGTKKLKGLHYKRISYSGETHLSEPVKAFYDGIRTVYPDWHLPYNSSSFRKTMTAKVIIERYEQLSQHYGYKVLPLHDEINKISRFLRNDSARIKDAIELLQLNALNYPHSPVVQENLGETYLKIRDKEKAVIAFRRALELDPSNKKLQQKIENIKK